MAAARDVAQGAVGVLALEFPGASCHGAQHAQPAQAFLLPIAAEELVEVLVVVDLVGRDAGAQVDEDRLARRLGQRPVVGGGAGLDHAARRHLQPARRGEQLHLAVGRVLGEEALEGRFPVELRPHVVDVGAQGAAVLQLLVLPVVAQPGRDLLVAGEEVDQVVGVEVGAALDEGRRAGQVEQRVVVADALERDAREVEVVDGPVRGFVASHAETPCDRVRAPRWRLARARRDLWAAPPCTLRALCSRGTDRTQAGAAGTPSGRGSPGRLPAGPAWPARRHRPLQGPKPIIECSIESSS